MSIFKDVINYCQIKAVLSRLSPDESSVWRKFCREYSIKFHTPLKDVLKMSPEHVILNIYELSFEELNLKEKIDDIYDLINYIEDPNYVEQKEKELQEFMEKVEKEEKERLKNNRPIHPKMEKETALPNESDLPKSGGIDLSYLENEENNF